MQALSQLSYGPTEGREFWGTPSGKSNRAGLVARGAAVATEFTGGEGAATYSYVNWFIFGSPRLQ